MQDYITILSNFGFPVAIACYLLFRFEKKLDALDVINRQLVDRITAMAVINQTLVDKIEKLEGDILKLTK